MMKDTPKQTIKNRIITGIISLMICCVLMPLNAAAYDDGQAAYTGYIAAERGDAAALLEQSPAAAEEYPEIVTYVTAGNIRKYGNVEPQYNGAPLTIDVLEAAGYEYADMITLTFGDVSVDMPLVEAVNKVGVGEAGLISYEEKTSALINMGDLATTYGFAVKSDDPDGGFHWTLNEAYSEPVRFTISMKEKGGYASEYNSYQLTYTNKREDYSKLTDNEFANFRAVDTTGMGKNVLYRTSSPLDPKRGRNTYADEAIRTAGVTVVMNMANSDKEIRAFEGFDQSYYATTDFIGLSMGMSYDKDDFREKLAEGLRFFARNKGIYAIHCLEGKDRTGFAVAVLECYMGASYDEVAEDYMESFANFYGVRPGDEAYADMLGNGIEKSLKDIFEVDDLRTADLKAKATEYIKGLGLSDEEMAALKQNLSEDKPEPKWDKTGNFLDVKAKSASISYGRLKKKSQKLTSGKLISFVNRGNGKISYKLTAAKKGSRSYRKYFKIDSSSGRLTVKKGLNKGTYKVSIRVRAAGDSKFKTGYETVKAVIRIR